MVTLTQEIPTSKLLGAAQSYREAARRLRSAADNLDAADAALRGRRWHVAQPAICRAIVDLEHGCAQIDVAGLEVEGGGSC